VIGKTGIMSIIASTNNPVIFSDEDYPKKEEDKQFRKVIS
jgi:hypothetical protein